MNRSALLASVHIAKKDLALDDGTYRSLLKRCVDKHSAGDCTDAQLQRFVRRQTDGVDAPEFCNHAQLTKVIEGLKGWRARLQSKQVAA